MNINRQFKSFAIQISGDSVNPLFFALDVGKVFSDKRFLKTIVLFDEFERVKCNTNVGIVRCAGVYLTKHGIRKIILMLSKHVVAAAFDLWVEDFITEMNRVTKSVRCATNYNIDYGDRYNPWYPGSQIAKVLGVNSVAQVIRLHVNPSNKKKEAIDLSKCLHWMVNYDGVKTLLSRRSCVKSRELAFEFGMDIDNVFHERVEIHALRQIIEIFPDDGFETQFPVPCLDSTGETVIFKIDLYSPKLKIAVEFDELEGCHAGEHNITHDEKRQQLIENTLSPVFIRIVPVIGSTMAGSIAISKIIAIKQKYSESQSSNASVHGADNMSCMETYLRMSDVRRKLSIVFVQDKCTPVRLFQKYFCLIYNLSQFQLTGGELAKFGVTVSSERVCTSCHRIAKCMDGKCAYCDVDYLPHRSCSQLFLIGLEITQKS